ncbi:hypothetical protein DIPPA_62313 [Diplonema papillatum]|nr:hypothetical protein DIPPA_62312 [Diplonema papillatum]KAJ9461825.1 hypothetical protein DIPPA_62313 [Diplonema papillatum]
MLRRAMGKAERATGRDLNKDGRVGTAPRRRKVKPTTKATGAVNRGIRKVEPVVHKDLNGDGRVGRRPARAKVHRGPAQKIVGTAERATHKDLNRDGRVGTSRSRVTTRRRPATRTTTATRRPARPVRRRTKPNPVSKVVGTATATTRRVTRKPRAVAHRR